jgi:hypothetical protein
MRISLSTLAAFAGFAAFAVALSAAPNVARAQAQTSICKDGTTSTATGKGACSGHGGVDAAKTKAAAKSAKSAKSSSKSAATPPAATAASVKSASPAKKDVAAAKSNNDKDAAGATAQCKDGTYSHAASHSGACSKHGGVAKFLK